MKEYSPYFNKRSRLLKIPEIVREEPIERLDFGPEQLKKRLSALLTIQNDFFPCFDWSFPPPLLNKASPPQDAHRLFEKPSITPGWYSIYLHSPFCKTLCNFCYYAVIPGHGIEKAETYVSYLIKEMALYAKTMEGQVCESIYFGGGTPSYLSNELLGAIFEGLNTYFDIEKGAEITLEAAPGTLGFDKLELLKEHGVNRLSYGIQTLDERLLADLNREYSVSVATEELENARSVIGNVNVDTMYGFDNEEDDALIKTLTRLHELGIPSLSIYALDKQRSVAKESFGPPKDELYDKKIEQFSAAKSLLGSLGYDQVLQNVFVNPLRSSYKHQLRRWDNLPLVALGVNAQGYAPRRPYQNTGSLKSYYQLIDEGKLPVVSMDELDQELELCRELTSKLRFTEVDIAEMKSKYGVRILNVYQHLITALEELGFVENSNNILRMTNSAAYYNNIIPMLFAPDSFKEKLLGLPEEYIEAFPIPYILTQMGASQSRQFAFSKAELADIPMSGVENDV